jgi:hypothetical protein
MTLIYASHLIEHFYPYERDTISASEIAFKDQFFLNKGRDQNTDCNK